MSNQPFSPTPSLEEAMRFHQSGRTAEAEALFREILRQNPANSPALHSLAILLADRGELAKAQVLAEEAIITDTKEPLYFRTLAKIYVQQQNYPKAIEAFRTSLYLKPLNSDALAELAETLEKQEDIYGAICHYKQALEQQENNGDIHFRLAKCLFKAGFSEEAIRHFERSHALLPFSHDVLQQYAHALILGGYTEKAAAVLGYGFLYFPRSAALLHLKGVLNFRVDAFDDSLTAYEQALEILPENRQILVDYAVCLRTVGDDKSAESVLKRIGALARGQ